MRFNNLPSYFKAHEQTIFFITTLIVVGGLVAGVVTYFDSQRAAEISNLTQIEQRKYELASASIDRSLAGQSHINIDKMIIDPDKGETSVLGAKEFSKEFFSVLSDVKGFTYSRSSQAGLIHLESAMALPPEVEAMSQSLPNDLWTGQMLKVTGPGASSSEDKPTKFFPAIVVEVWEKNKYIDHALGTDKGAFLPPKVQKLRNNLESDDNQQLLAQLFVNALVDPLQSGVVAKRVELRGHFAYVQLISEYGDINVGSSHYQKYFVIREIFTILSHERLYFISIILPTAEPLSISPYSASINQFLQSFRILP